MNTNFLLQTNPINVGQEQLYDPDIIQLYAYFGTTIPTECVTMFGLQYLMATYLEGIRFTKEDIDEAADFWPKQLGQQGAFDRALWDKLLQAHGGVLPIRIRAIDEGFSLHNQGAMPLLNVINTDYDFPWIVPYLEPLFMQLWYPIAVASESRMTQQNMYNHFHRATSFKGNYNLFSGGSFSESKEASMIADAAHLLFFHATQNPSAVRFIEKFYGASLGNTGLSGISHNLSKTVGDEVTALEMLLNKYPDGDISVTADTKGVRGFVDDVLPQFVDRIKARPSGSFVIALSEGNANDVLTWISQELGRLFGMTANDQNYNVLNSKVRLFWTAPLDRIRISEALNALRGNLYSPENYIFTQALGGRETGNLVADNFTYTISALRRKNGSGWDNIRQLGSRNKKILVGAVEYDAYRSRFATVESDDSSFKQVFRNGVITRPTKYEKMLEMQ